MAGMEESSKAQPDPPAASRSVFLSYASGDAAAAQTVCQFLESHGASCWMAPRDVRPGAQYADAIVRAINDSSALVVVLSASAVASSHVAREVERAGSKQKPLIAFRIDGASLSPALEYFLSDSQWIDVLALGMPAALVKLSEAVGQGAPPSPRGPLPAMASGAGGNSRRVIVAATWVALIGAEILLGVHFWPPTHSNATGPVAARITSTPISDKSIAVLPLANESGEPNQQYFSDGISEDLITALGQFPGLKVIGRSSAFQFRDSKEDSRSIGAKLGVAHLLEGSVRKSGDMVRVSAELIDTADGSAQWSEHYDRPYKDLFALQDEITRAVAGR